MMKRAAWLSAPSGDEVMGIRSGHFSGVILSGKDIQKFERQIEKQGAPKAAVAMVKRGEKLAFAFRDKGYVTLDMKQRKSR
jgi:hypothetical protein